MRNQFRAMHYAWKTEQAYVMWIERFLRFHSERNRGRWRRAKKMAVFGMAVMTTGNTAIFSDSENPDYFPGNNRVRFNVCVSFVFLNLIRQAYLEFLKSFVCIYCPAFNEFHGKMILPSIYSNVRNRKKRSPLIHSLRNSSANAISRNGWY
ncbi:MAG: hypothetical protein CME33_09315 [Gimesia sp.]|uniref:hypothetical protein n=1 Tax=Gimesia sp. TaxID=2024833 RepID=UPI000C48475C|nr:hypothetical protein [Gimesia sp.]